ncbi:multiple epidermal growth factor-like domains protein 10 [Haliotis cracherodii]|uniref:multiple epidermal growth factor-like domains protein 10 n=1 Tax=Haliotis cracherodii TaxID=6455 RepID=UPI0039ECE9AA
MALAVILVLMSMVVSTQGLGCLEGQHCSECRRTGYCKSKCFSGYFGVKCKARCRNSCLNGACESSETGLGRCTEGCASGYHGTYCTRPCARQEATCTKCGSECKEGYCQLASSCVDGCVDRYYGSDCENCSSRCKTCNRITGTCDECYPLYTGPDCHYSGLCETGCMEGCGRHVSGYFCVEVCSHNCRLHTNMKETTRCLPPGRNASVYCTSECHNQSGECLHGCVEGWYGPRCSSPCSAGCSDGRCDAAGACVDGCITGYSGEFCNETCEMCRGEVCDQKTGTCINGCDVSKHGCETSCTSNCSREYCDYNETCSDARPTGISETGFGLNIGLPTACVLFVLATLVLNYVCYRKGQTKQRVNLANAECSPVVEYESWHRYYDIEEGDLNVEEPAEGQGNLEEEPGLIMPVIADVFDPVPAIVHRDEDMSTESSASSTIRSYTHLIPDVASNAPSTADGYISPEEELTLHPPDP